MLEPFEKNIRSVWIRCSINLLLRYAGRVLTAAGGVVVLIVLAERLLALSILRSNAILSFWGVVIALIVLLWLLRQPSRMQVSLLLDDRLRLHERFSTTLALSKSDDPFADAACSESRRTARRVNLKGHFPIRPSRCWIYAVSTWLLATALILGLPQKDLLGFLSRNRKQQEQARQLEKTKVDVKQATEPIKAAVKQLANPELEEALSELEQASKEAKPQDIKREAIRKLGDLSEKIKDMKSGVQMDAVKMLKQSFKRLRGSSDPLSQQLRLALAKGNFAQASELLKQLQKDIAEGKLSEQQQKALAGQLQELGQQIKELAKRNAELEKELEKLGLDKSLAGLDKDQLQDALQKQGLSTEQIQKLMKMAEASQMAMSQCEGLGSAMAACGGGAGGTFPGDLGAVTDQLDSFESLNQQLMFMEYSLAEINNAIAGLGEGQGLGMYGTYDYVGEGGGVGDGIGTQTGPHYLADPLAQSAMKKTRAASKVGEGPVIASWYFHGPQVKGEAQRDFTEVIQSARDSAAEAISENQIPRRYEESIKNYFGRLEQSETQ